MFVKKIDNMASPGPAARGCGQTQSKSRRWSTLSSRRCVQLPVRWLALFLTMWLVGVPFVTVRAEFPCEVDPEQAKCCEMDPDNGCFMAGLYRYYY